MFKGNIYWKKFGISNDFNLKIDFTPLYYILFLNVKLKIVIPKNDSQNKYREFICYDVDEMIAIIIIHTQQ